jgi:hypothetical protein
MIDQLKRAIKIAYIPFFGLWLNFVITFTAFPGLVLGMGLKFMEGIAGFIPIAVVLIFNIFDTIGKHLGGMPFARNFGTKMIALLLILPLILLIFFFLFNCNVGPSWLFGKDADWFKVFCLSLIALSNGFISTCAAI